jgi:hypothetical protein
MDSYLKYHGKAPRSSRRGSADFFRNIDNLVKSPKAPFLVIPAKAGIQYFRLFWTPAFAGVTFQVTFYETINIFFQFFIYFLDKFFRFI